MKLFRKIYLRVMLGMLVLSMVMMGYLLWETQRKTLEDTVESEVASFRLRTLNFQEQVRKNSKDSMGASVRKTVAVNAFRNAFGSRGILRMDGEEVFNVSPYEFDWEELESGSSDHYERAYSTAPQEVEGRKLLIFFENKTGLRSGVYELVTYKDVTDIFARSRTLFLRGCGVTLLLLLALGTVLYRGIYRVLRPMLELRQAAAAIADGRYGIRIPVRSRDEIREVTVSFNRMAEKVEEHMAALVTANEKQRQLLGSLAHELKTPMTAIIGYADTLLTVRLPEAKRERALAYIHSEGKRLARLSEKMLELTGLYESGGEGLDMREVRIAELLRRLADLTSFRLGEKELRLEKSCVPGDLTRRVDEDLMLSLLMNLVDNACKASLPGGVIQVRGEADRIVVEDFGKGIPEAELRHVTEAFYMVDKSRAKSAGSVGLGLSLCRQIAVLHGAELEIESREGKGTKVSVRWTDEKEIREIRPVTGVREAERHIL